MTKPIQLTKEKKRSWVPQPSETSTLLTNVMFVITEALASKTSASDKNKIFKKNSIEDSLYNRFVSNIFAYFSSQNHGTSAVVGAFFRSFAYQNMLILTEEDKTHLTDLVKPINTENIDAVEFLKKFCEGRSPKEAHIAFLKDLLFNAINDENFKKLQGKNSGTVDKVIDSVLSLVEFMNTPFSVLVAEAEHDKNATSPPDQAIGTIISGLKQALENLCKLKNKSSTNMEQILNSIHLDLLKFQGAFGVQVKQLELDKAEITISELKEKLSELEKIHNVDVSKTSQAENNVKELQEANASLRSELHKERERINQASPTDFSLFATAFIQKFKKTNSTGIKTLMREIQTLMKSDTPDNEKMALLASTMRSVANDRKDSRWSKSHYIFKGRQADEQKFYDLLSNKKFTITAKNDMKNLLSTLNITLDDSEIKSTPFTNK